MNVIYAYLLDRAKERTTWIGGLTIVATLFGVTVSPSHAELIAGVASAVAGAALLVVRDHKPVLPAVEEVVEEAVKPKKNKGL